MYYSKTKRPASVLDYTFDWSLWLNGDTISTSIWTAENGITINSENETSTLATVWLAGGTDGSTYKVTNRITTNGGRTDERELHITVAS